MFARNVLAVIISCLFVTILSFDVKANSSDGKHGILNMNYSAKQIAQATMDEANIEEAKLSTRAAIVLENLILEPPDRHIPTSLLSKAKCIGVFPSVAKAGLIVAGQHGHGLVSCRHDKTKKWGAPAYFTVTGASFGVQAGYKTADIIMLVMDPKGVDALLSGAMTIGSGNVSATSGSVGHEADVATMRSSIITYARPDKGLFAGADLQGSSIAYDGKTIEKVYGVLMGPYETLYKLQKFPNTVRDFHDILTKFAPGPKN